MKKLQVKDVIVLIRLIVTLACCTTCATSIILLPVLWGMIVSGLSFIALTLVLIATEPYCNS